MRLYSYPICCPERDAGRESISPLAILFSDQYSDASYSVVVWITRNNYLILL